SDDVEEEPAAPQLEPVEEPFVADRQLVEEPEPISAEQEDDLTSRERTDDNDFYDAEEGPPTEEQGKLRNGEEVADVEDFPDDVTVRAAQSGDDNNDDVEDSR